MKGQVAMEYLMFIGILLLLLVIVVYMVAAQERGANRERVINDAKRIAMMISNEITVANDVGDGYSHNFSVPYRLQGGVPYNIYTLYQRIYLNWSENGQARDVSLPLLTSNIDGNFSQGENRIRNINGLIKID